MSCLLIRCRSCTPASTVELTGWIEDKVAQLSNGTPQAAVRLTRLVQDLPTATLDDGWLIEIRLEGERGEEHSDALTAALEEILRDMRILGLDPTLLVPGTLALGDEEPVLAMRRAHIKLETVPADSRPAGPAPGGVDPEVRRLGPVASLPPLGCDGSTFVATIGSWSTLPH